MAAPWRRTDELDRLRTMGAASGAGDAALAGLLAALGGPLAAEPQPAAPHALLLRAMSEAACSRAARSPWNRLRMLATTAAAKVAIIAAVVLGGTAAAAAAGSLPSPVQHLVARAFADVGLRIGPSTAGREPARGRGEHRAVAGASAPTWAPGGVQGARRVGNGLGRQGERTAASQAGKHGSGQAVRNGRGGHGGDHSGGGQPNGGGHAHRRSSGSSHGHDQGDGKASRGHARSGGHGKSNGKGHGRWAARISAGTRRGSRGRRAPPPSLG